MLCINSTIEIFKTGQRSIPVISSHEPDFLKPLGQRVHKVKAINSKPIIDQKNIKPNFQERLDKPGNLVLVRKIKSKADRHIRKRKTQ